MAKHNHVFNKDMHNYCENDTEHQALDARLASKNIKEATEKCNIERHRLGRILKKVRNRYYSDPNFPRAEGKEIQKNIIETIDPSGKLIPSEEYFIKGESILYNADGEIRAKWIKTSAVEKARFDALKAAIENIASKLEGGNLKLDIPKTTVAKTSKDELTVYPMGDMHIGLFSWAAETGEDYDLNIAKKYSIEAYSKLINSAPNTETAMLINLGDFFHIDNYDGKTIKSGNQLDFDTRWPKVLETGLLIMIDIINMLLRKHNKIIIRNVAGNHDPHSTIFLNAYIKAWFGSDDRIIVEDKPSAFWFYKWGKNLIGSTHGDTVKMDNLPEIMAADASHWWSDTEFRYWYIGHVHHSQKKEYRTCMVESFGTLAAKDSWHTASGYRSQRQIKFKVLHKKFGETQEGTVNIKMIKKDK